jgi:hypothetical protein
MGVGSAAYKMADDLAVCPDNGVALATQVR